MKRTASIERQLADLPQLDRRALEHQYTRLRGQKPPKGSADDLLRLSVACRLQQQLIARFRSRMFQALTAAEAITSLVIEGSRNTILLGQWHGAIHEIEVLEDGAMYRGNYYASVQTVVEAITKGRKTVEQFFGSQVPRDGR